MIKECSICGDVGSNWFYGTISCVACKVLCLILYLDLKVLFFKLANSPSFFFLLEIFLSDPNGRQAANVLVYKKQQLRAHTKDSRQLSILSLPEMSARWHGSQSAFSGFDLERLHQGNGMRDLHSAL